MREDIVYGTKGDKPGFGKFVKMFMGVEQDRHLGINWTNEGTVTVWHFWIRDTEDYENFRDELIAVLKDCEDIGAAYLALEVYLGSEYADDFLEDYSSEKEDAGN